MNRLLRQYLNLGIVGPLPNNLADGQAADAVPVMQNFNFIVSQINANAAALATVTALQSTVNGYGARAPFTPVVQFGGANVGLTYNTNGQTGYQFPVQNAVFVVGSVWVANKGSSTGVLTITGLPTSANVAWPIDGFPMFVLPRLVNIPGATGGLSVIGEVSPGTGTMLIVGPTSGGSTSQFSQLDVANGFALSFMGLYPIS